MPSTLPSMWEIEMGPDGTYDLLLDGSPQYVGLESENVREHFYNKNIDINEVEGYKLLK